MKHRLVPSLLTALALPSLAIAAPKAPAEKRVSLTDVGLDGKAFDTSVKPCDDFYKFACGSWLQSTPVPSDRSSWTRSFSEIDKQNENDLRAILEGMKPPAKGRDKRTAIARKLGDFYASCMDESAIEAAGTTPIQPLLTTVAGVQDLASLQAALVTLAQSGISAPIRFGSEQNPKQATQVILGVDQGGLGLPDRDYYLKDDAKSVELRGKYQAHVERMLVLAGRSAEAAQADAARVLALETALAKVSKSRVERRDPEAMYNKIDRPGLLQHAPNYPWRQLFGALGKAELVDVDVSSVPFLEGMDAQLRETPPEAWRAYLTFKVVAGTAHLLGKAFVDESFALGKALTGQKELPLRWKRCIDATDGALGELLAQPYVARRFAGSSKKATESMVAEISRAFAAGLARLEWMDEPTRAKAHEKLKAFAFHIGYPVRWKSYDWTVTGSYAANALASRRFELARDLAKIGMPVDRQEWEMTPPTVNAYYNPPKNEMVFPAGILQPPFYNPKASLAVNMGGMGMVVGHELTHGFDDEGSKFAADGNLQSWWAPETREKFESRTQCLVDQYGSYEPLPGVRLNGKLTLGENIADLGGVKLAFEAYRAMRQSAPERLVADGYSEDQQFFLAVAQAWCTNTLEERARMLANVDPHSPPRFRVNGSLSNQPAFWEAFQCAEGTPMHPANACTVW